MSDPGQTLPPARELYHQDSRGSGVFFTADETVVARAVSTRYLGSTQSTVFSYLGNFPDEPTALASLQVVREVRVRRKKDPNQPRKPRSPYHLFLHAHRGDVAQLPAAKRPVELNRLWKQLPASERMVWTDKAQAERVRFEAEMASYQRPPELDCFDEHVRTGHRRKRLKRDQREPKRPQSAFEMFWAREASASLLEAAAAWAAMPAAERAVFEAAAAEADKLFVAAVDGLEAAIAQEHDRTSAAYAASAGTACTAPAIGCLTYAEGLDAHERVMKALAEGKVVGGR